jgi:Fe-S-cluster containining protein
VPQADIPVENKCSRCLGSTCCTYTTEALGTLRSKADFGHLLWQVSHQHVEAYRDSSGWYLLMRGNCEHLRPGGACGIYETRPQVCRDYANDWCEFDEAAEQHFLHHFRNYAELLAYCRKRFKRWESP